MMERAHVTALSLQMWRISLESSMLLTSLQRVHTEISLSFCTTCPAFPPLVAFTKCWNETVRLHKDEKETDTKK